MKLIIGGYSQLPFGSPNSSLERMLSAVLKPVLNFLYQNQSVCFNLYLSAKEIEWIESNHPEVNLMISALVKRNQLNILTGSYYQSILQTTPVWERSEQIEKMTTLIRKRYGNKADTLWLFNQVWTPATIGVMSLAGVNNLFISTYDSVNDKNFASAPFIMNELGKTVNIYPIDDRYSALIRDYSDGLISTRKLLEEAEATIPYRSCEANTVMLNIDQLSSGALDGWKIFETIVSSYRSRGITTGFADFDSDLSDVGYLSASWYGRDDVIQKGIGFGEYVSSDLFLSTVYDLRCMIDELYRQNKKTDKANRKMLENAMMRASSGAVFSHAYSRPPVVQEVLGNLYTAFDAVAEGEIPSGGIMYDGKRIHFSGKNFTGVFSSLGGSVLTFIFRPIKWCYSGSSSLFTDFFRPATAQKTRNLSRERYTAEIINKKNNDVSFTYKGEINKKKYAIKKTYHIKTSMVVVDVELTNLGSEELSGVYSVSLPIFCNGILRTPLVCVSDKAHSVTLSEGEAVLEDEKSLKIQDSGNGVNIVFGASKPFAFSKNEENAVFKDGSVYRDTLIIPSWNVKLQSSEKFSLTLALRIEQTKQH